MPGIVCNTSNRWCQRILRSCITPVALPAWPKGAMLTHRNMLANLEQVNATYGPLLHPGNEVVITALPLYHTFCADHELPVH